MHDGHRRLQEAFEKNKIVEKENLVSVSDSVANEVLFYSFHI